MRAVLDAVSVPFRFPLVGLLAQRRWVIVWSV
jgi:hypothetical protein